MRCLGRGDFEGRENEVIESEDVFTRLEEVVKEERIENQEKNILLGPPFCLLKLERKRGENEKLFYLCF